MPIAEKRQIATEMSGRFLVHRDPITVRHPTDAFVLETALVHWL